MSDGWLVAQLPRVLAEDQLLAGIASIAEKIGDSVRRDLDDLEHQLDVAAAPPPMLRYVASWVGADLDPGVPTDRQRELLRAIGPLLGWRGTRRGLQDVLEALTGGRVRVFDSGGVVTAAQDGLTAEPVVTVELDGHGVLTPAQLRAYIDLEVPVGTRVEIRAPAGPAEGGGP